MDLELVGEVVRGLLPTVGVTLLFGIAILAIVRADAGERADRARLEAEEDAAARAERAAEDAAGRSAEPGAGRGAEPGAESRGRAQGEGRGDRSVDRAD